MSLTASQLKTKLLHEKELMLNDLEVPDLSMNKCSIADGADAASIVINRENALALYAHKVNKLQNIEKALTRIHSDEDLLCHDCDEDLSQRLAVIPEAIRCVKCESEHNRIYFKK